MKGYLSWFYPKFIEKFSKLNNTFTIYFICNPVLFHGVTILNLINRDFVVCTQRLKIDTNII